MTLQPLDLRRNAKEADGVLFNYFRALNPKYSDEVRDFGEKTTPKLNERTLEIAEEIRNEALKFVTKGRPSPALSVENRAFAERLRTVRFRIRKNFSHECISVGDPGVPNANYNPLEHTITICASATRVTSQWIALTMAHELGHTISACSMGSPLVKFKEPSYEIDRCLFDESYQHSKDENRDETDAENYGGHVRSVGYESEPRTYAVNHEPESISKLLSCGGAEVLPASQILKPRTYEKFSRCIEPRNQTAYENWIAKSTLALDFMPKTLSPKWKSLVDKAKGSTPPRCFRKSEEQFADSFGGLVYSSWAKEKKLSGTQFKLALDDIAMIRCRERLTGEISMNRTLYATPSERIETLVNSSDASKILQCTLPTTATCSLNETSFDDPETASRKRLSPKVPSSPSQVAQ